jgi:hypothetical protein
MMSRLYFLITATDSLRSRLAGSGSDVAELLTETRLWSASHADLSNWATASRTVAVKLLFLADILQEMLDDVEFKTILGNLPLTAATFDKWWTVTPLQVDEDFEDVAARLTPSVLIKIGETGIHAVDEWVEELRSSQKV